MNTAVEVEVKLCEHLQRAPMVETGRPRNSIMGHRGAGGNVFTKYPEPGAPVTEQGNRRFPDEWSFLTASKVVPQVKNYPVFVGDTKAGFCCISPAPCDRTSCHARM